MWPYQSVFANGYFVVIDKDAIGIDKGIGTNGNMFTIITQKRGFYPDSITAVIKE